MPELDNFAVAVLLEEFAARLELSGESPFKTRAYQRAAEVVRGMEEPLAPIIAARRLQELPGIGEALAEKITSLQRTGTHPTLERLRQAVPDGLLQLTHVPGLGAKRVLQLRAALGVQDLDDLEAALRDGRLAGLKGFGEKLQAKLLDAATFVRGAAERFLLPQADELVEAACRQLRAFPGVVEVSPAGETRRRCELVSGPAVVVAARAPESIPARLPPAKTVQAIAVRPALFGFALLYETGAAKHLAALEARAARASMTLSRTGLRQCADLLPARTEEEIYATLNLPFILPEWREGNGEVEAAAGDRLPIPLQCSDVKGLLHCHTRYSDGLNDVDQMAEAARALGMTYLGIADHSQSAFYAGGLKEDAIRRQREEIARVNDRYAQAGTNFRVFHGIESDIREDGALDYPDDELARFDFVIASIHSRFEQDEQTMTARLVRAVSHPATTVLGHPTGRLLRRRPGYALDLEAVLAACAEHGVAVELNAHPERLDLDWRHHARVLELGLKLSINPDAHAAGELSYFRYGVDIARKGRVPATRVLNALDVNAIAAYFRRRRKQ